MPIASSSNPGSPAIWMLNGQIMRAVQYGCNCRGMGGAGGCGELDICETVLASDSTGTTPGSTFLYF